MELRKPGDVHKINMRKTINLFPALSTKERPRDYPNAIENINQSGNKLRLLRRELCMISISTGPQL